MSMSQEIKDFVKTFSDTRNSLWKNAYMNFLMQKKNEDTNPKNKPDDIAKKGAKIPTSANSVLGVGVKEGRSVATADPVSDLEPHQKAFLNGIAAGESGGKYDVRYSPQGGATFDDYSAHPAIFEQGPDGPSSAAGRYQITKSTWDGLDPSAKGDGTFAPANQDKAAWTLAQDDYRARTGKDLDYELRTKGMTPEITQALSPTWTSLKDPSNSIATYNDSMKRYDAQQDASQDAEDDRVSPAAPPTAIPTAAPATAYTMPAQQQVSQAIPLDPYHTEAVYAATGGLVPALPVKHYAAGGSVDDDDEDITSPTSTINLARQGATASGASSDDDDESTPSKSIVPAAFQSLPFSGVPDAVHDGITYIQNKFGLGQPGAVATTDGAKRALSGEGALSKDDEDALDKTVDPDGTLTPQLRKLAGMNAVYQHYMDIGDRAKAASVAGAMLLRSQTIARSYGEAALRAPNEHVAAKIVAEGYNNTVPDGKEIQVGDDGTWVQRDAATGKPLAGGKYTPQQILQAATGMRNGTAFWQEVQGVAGMSRNGPSAAQQNAAAGQKAVADFEALNGARAQPVSGAPTQAVPTSPTAPAQSVSADPVVAQGDDDTGDTYDENAPTQVAVASPGAAPKGRGVGAAAASTGMPANFIDSLPTQAQKDAWRNVQLKQPRYAAIREREYANQVAAKAAAMPQAGKDPTPTALHQIDSNINKAWDDRTADMKTPDGKPIEVPAQDARNMKSLARNIALANPNTHGFADDAIDASTRLLNIDKSTPVPLKPDGTPDLNKAASSLPFTLGRANGGYQVTFKDGSAPIKLPASAVPTLKNAVSRELTKIAKTQKPDAPNTFTAGVQRVGDVYQRSLPPSTPQQAAAAAAAQRAAQTPAPVTPWIPPVATPQNMMELNRRGQ